MMRLSYVCLFSLIAISSAFDCKGKTGSFKDADNPHKFVVCDNGKDTHLTCPDDLVFDETANECNFGVSDPKTTSSTQSTGSTSKPTVTNSITSSTQPKTTQTDPPKTTQTDPPKITQTKATEPVTAKTTEKTAKLTTQGVQTEPTRGRHNPTTLSDIKTI